MKIHQFVAEAIAMRNGQHQPRVGVPRSFNRIKAARVIHEKLDAAYGTLWSFSIKHPDSTRTAKARRRDLERHQARAVSGRAA